MASTGAAGNNITTLQTFKDGREYLLSLTTTVTPCTVSFWISDKITAEEWTSCYDEKSIELITQRTGCFKSFKTFISMLTSAMTKKSESVALELLDIQDLASLTVQKRHGHHSTGSASAAPLNFDLFKNDAASSDLSIPISHQNSNNCENMKNPQGKSPPPQIPPNALNKRKYLIVSYMAEFDKVHYPLPLSYTNPPDLNVMQNNIMRLKAEVISLKRSNKELEDQLESNQVSGIVSQHSHENKSEAVANYDGTLRNHTKGMRKEQLLYELQRQLKQGDLNAADIPTWPDCNTEDVNANKPVCLKCSGSINALKAKVNLLEEKLKSQQNTYQEAMEMLHDEVSFLRRKIETLKSLESLPMMEKQRTRDKSNPRINQTVKNPVRKSRHDLFYKSETSPIKTHTTSRRRGQYESPYSQERICEPLMKNSHRSRSNSTSAMMIGSDRKHKGYSSPNKENNSCYRSLYHPLNYVNRTKKSRPVSLSPTSRFDPTAYIHAKKAKQKMIADLRLQQIEKQRRRSASRHSEKSPSPRRIQNHLKPKSSSSFILSRSNSRESSNFRETRGHREVDIDSFSQRKSMRDRCERSPRNIAKRSSSMDTFILKTRRSETSSRGQGGESDVIKDVVASPIPNRQYSSKGHTDPYIKDNPIKRDKVKGTETRSFYSGRLEKTPRQLDSPHIKEPKGRNEKRDLSILQDKLSALNQFLEICKNKG